MPGLTDLEKTLSQLSIACDDVEYGFCTVLELPMNLAMDKILATFVEDEGNTIVAPVEYLNALELQFEGPFAKLTIQVQTSLELVGLTAALARVLTEANIPANVIAAYYHDHIFVQYSLKDQAVAAIKSLSKQ